jgi:serine/threonine-protein kinase
MPAAPTLGDRYIMGRELGRGSMGVVYEAEDTILARTVAVKTIELAFDAGAPARKQFEQRFFTEARVAARLSHPGIVVCHDVGKDPASGKLFIVFEYLKGRTLAARVAEGPIAWRDALAVVVQVARAIHHAHEHGVIHRDLKPANVMLLDARRDAAVKIMDFGVARLESLGARLTGPGQSFGSPLYTSPEQALGENSSARSDIFSLGSVLCTLVLGRPWFDAPSIPEIVRRVVHDDGPRISSLRPEVPAALDVVVATALAKREDDRYASAADMADDLDEVLAGRTAIHAGAVKRSPARARPSGEDTLLDGLIAPVGGLGRFAAPDPAAAVASLLDEATRSIPRAQPAAAPAPPTGRSRRWMAPAGAAIALLAAATVFLWPRPSAIEPTPSPSAPTPPQESLAPSALPAPRTITPAEFVGPSWSPASPSAPPATAPLPVPTAPPATLAAAPAEDVARALEPAPGAAPDPAGRTRMRLSVDHPFENGRLIVWIDGVVAFETKLQAPVSKKIVAIKVREGRLETLLDVAPGKHEVRVEVTWDQERRVATKVADAAAGSTGLLEVRVGRMSKDLTLQWSRLVKN